MSKAVFKSEQSFLALSHENLFHCGIIKVPYKYGVSPAERDLEKMRKMGIPAPQMYDASYLFLEGEDNNLLTLTTDEEIEAMRVYIKSRGDRDKTITEITEEAKDENTRDSI